MDTQTWIALGATVVALVGAATNIWNVNRSIRHNSRENLRRDLLEASDRFAAVLVKAHKLVGEIDEQIDGIATYGHYRKSDVVVRGLFERADAFRTELETARIILLSRQRDVDRADALTDCVESFDGIVLALESSLEGWESIDSDHEAMSVNATVFHRAYDAYLGPHARLHGPRGGADE